jgi:hypothetical protein
MLLNTCDEYGTIHTLQCLSLFVDRYLFNDHHTSIKHLNRIITLEFAGNLWIKKNA